MGLFSRLLFFLVLILAMPFAFSQNVNSKDSKYIAEESGRWNIDKYLWSYARNKLTKHGKSIVDFNAIDDWQRLGDYLSVSPNGRYFAYTIESIRRSFGSDGNVDSLIVQSIDSSKRLVFADAKPGSFTRDSRIYVFSEGAKLCFLQLDRGEAKFVENVASYKMQDKGADGWVAYQRIGESDVVLQNLATGRGRIFPGMSDYEFYENSEMFICRSNSSGDVNAPKDLVVYKLVTGKEKRFPLVVDYLFADSGKGLLLKTREKTDSGAVTALKYTRLAEGKERVIWSTKADNVSISNYSMDKPGEQVVFNVRDSAGFAKGWLVSNSIWYYKHGMSEAVLKVTNEKAGIDKGLQLAGSAGFTDNGRYIQFFLQPKPSLRKTHTDAVQVEVWNHKDLILQSAQSYLLEQPKVYNAVISVASGRIIQLETEGRSLHLLQGNFAIVKKLCKDTYGDRFWEEGYGYERDSNWLVSLYDGNWQLLGSKEEDVTKIGPFWFSPGGNYLIYFDFDKQCRYFSYYLRTGKLIDLSARVDIQPGYIDPYLRSDRKPRHPLGLAAWLEGDAGVLIYDNNDIWKFDLQGKKSAVNLTNGFGRSNDIIFSLFSSQRFENVTPILDQSESLILRAFNVKNKYSGFYRTIIGNAGDPEVLYMGRCFMHMIPWCQDPNLSNKGMPPIKASETGIWIVQRQSDKDAPNYYKTTDFKLFERLTNFQPQQEYNWLSEELQSFRHLDGASGQGILYKPENFDPSKKYPVLIVLYGAHSNNLYQFPIPDYNNKAITPGVSPVWFLNNGYLVFTPDIYVAPLRYGPEASNVIEGAVRYLSQLPYVDANRLGCCSHSWSAKLGTYLFTHSTSFAAMAISEGFLYGNMINVALSTDDNGASKLENVEEVFQFGNLWENRDSWLDQTAVLNVDSSNSPLLLFCNKESSKEYQDQTLQLFTASRRLEKKVWWLKYDKGGHTLSDLNEQKDYTIRYSQFFDHYLKGAPAPRWMTQGIPAGLKGFQSGYELDPSGSCGNHCRICKKWNEQYKQHSGMFGEAISEWRID